MDQKTSYHEGSMAVQERTGERAVAARLAAAIHDSVTPPAQAFLESQHTLALGAVDAHGQPWASLWLGSPGLIRVLDSQRLRFTLDTQALAADDPVRGLLHAGNDLGLLAIDLVKRRRLRVNGRILQAGEEHLDLQVHEVFGNCPKYIQQRERVAVDAHPGGGGIQRGEKLDASRRELIASVDTLFVASRHPVRGADVSHRGGSRGFVQVLDAHTLRLPDYPGNSMFQTLGNFATDPRAGMLMVDFENHRFLALTGRVAVSYDIEIPGHPSGGTKRYWTVAVQAWAEFPMPAGDHFRFVTASPYNPPPGGNGR